MPGSLLSINRKVKRRDSTRSDASTYSSDSKKKVSFDKAVRVKKYTKSEDGDQRLSGNKFWFKVYRDVHPDEGDDQLKTIDECRAADHVGQKLKEEAVLSGTETFVRIGRTNQSYQRLLSPRTKPKNHRIADHYPGIPATVGSRDPSTLLAARLDASPDRSEGGRFGGTTEERRPIRKTVTGAASRPPSSPKVVDRRREEAEKSHRSPAGGRRHRGVALPPAEEVSDKHRAARSADGRRLPPPDKGDGSLSPDNLRLSRARCACCAEGAGRRSRQESRRTEPVNPSDSGGGGPSGRSPNGRKPGEAAPAFRNVRITVNGEEVDDGSVRGGLAAAFHRRQRRRNSGSGSPGSEGESVRRHRTVFLYVPGADGRGERAGTDRESSATPEDSRSVRDDVVVTGKESRISGGRRGRGFSSFSFYG